MPLAHGWRRPNISQFSSALSIGKNFSTTPPFRHPFGLEGEYVGFISLIVLQNAVASDSPSG
tara:strand:+ start:238 stop:423 length:186 start_codon:yes stop_codon:yes gene_type:complete